MTRLSTEYVIIEISQPPRVLASFTVRHNERPDIVRALIVDALRASDFDPFSSQTLDGCLTIRAREC